MHARLDHASRLHSGRMRDSLPTGKLGLRLLRIELHDATRARKRHELVNAHLGRMANDVVHLVALGKALEQRNACRRLRRIETLRDARHQAIVRRGDFQFEIIARRIDNAYMLALGQTQHPRVFGVFRRKAHGEFLRRLFGDNLAVKKKMME